jgi:hypothetical protein
MKPLGKKNYGSIPHLPGSRVGPGDYHISEGQARIATIAPRDKNDWIITQEKLDGSNVGVCKVNGIVYPLTRSGWLATTSKFKVHHEFAEWFETEKERFNALLNEGERVCGEWLGMAVGTRYELPHEPFVVFDLMKGDYRFPWVKLRDRVSPFHFILPRTLSMGSPLDIESAIMLIDGVSGHGAIDPVEGVIWRVERNGEVDFLAKYVHHFKQDGKYFPERNNGVTTYNWKINEPSK